MNLKLHRSVLFASLFVCLATGVWQRNVKDSLMAALFTAVGTMGGLLLVERDKQRSELATQSTLQSSIAVLQQEQEQLQTYVNETFQLEQDLSASVRSLKSERLRLLNRIGSLHQQRNQMAAMVKQLKQENEVQTNLKVSTQALLSELQQQHQKLQSKIDAHAALDALAPEVRLTRVQHRLSLVRKKLAEQQHQQKLVQTELAIAQEQKIDLEGSLYDLRAEFNVLEQRYQELQENLRISEEQYKEISFGILGGKAAIQRLLRDILQKRQEKAALIAEVEGLQELSPQAIPSELLGLLPSTWQAWLQFVQHLNPEEQEFLKLILAQDSGQMEALPTAIAQSSVADLENILQEQAMLFLGESPFIRVADRPLPQLKAEYQSLLEQQSLFLPTPEDRCESTSS